MRSVAFTAIIKLHLVSTVNRYCHPGSMRYSHEVDRSWKHVALAWIGTEECTFDKPSRSIIYTNPLLRRLSPRCPDGARTRQVIARSKASAKIARKAHARLVMKTWGHESVFDGLSANVGEITHIFESTPQSASGR